MSATCVYPSASVNRCALAACSSASGWNIGAVESHMIKSKITAVAPRSRQGAAARERVQAACRSAFA